MAKTKHNLVKYILIVFVFVLIFFIPKSALALKCCLNEPGSFNVTPTVNGTTLSLTGTVTGGECSCACIIGIDGGRFNEEDGDPLSTYGGEIDVRLARSYIFI